MRILLAYVAINPYQNKEKHGKLIIQLVDSITVQNQCLAYSDTLLFLYSRFVKAFCSNSLGFCTKNPYFCQKKP